MKLKSGIEIRHKNKKYVDEIPDEIFKEIYGNLTEDEKENKKLFDAKVKKFKHVPEKKESVKEDELKKPSN